VEQFQYKNPAFVMHRVVLAETYLHTNLEVCIFDNNKLTCSMC